MVRVGGGYLSIDEFLEQYTILELEKLEQRGGIDINEYLTQQQIVGSVEATKEEMINNQRPSFAKAKYEGVSRYSPKVYMKSNGRASPGGAIAGRSSPGMVVSNGSVMKVSNTSSSVMNMTTSQMMRSQSKEALNSKKKSSKNWV